MFDTNSACVKRRLRNENKYKIFVQSIPTDEFTMIEMNSNKKIVEH